MTSGFKLTIPGPKPKTFTKKEIRALLALREETITDLARRLDCTRESLSRLLNSRSNSRIAFPKLQKKLEAEVARMVNGDRAYADLKREAATA